MTLKRALATTAAIAIGFLAASSPALAQERTPQGFVVDGPFSVQEGESNGIIAILIGFTPPIGSNKGSVIATPSR